MIFCDILECIQDSFFTHYVLLPTRGDNILNLVVSNNEGLVENITVVFYKMEYGNNKD